MSAKAGAKPELVDDPSLPVGWFAAKNEDGEVYYFNEDNGEVRYLSSWSQPCCSLRRSVFVLL
jgi:hypothetical protein